MMLAVLVAAAVGGGFTELRDGEGGLRVDLRYATRDNFVGEAVYPRARCLLRTDVAARLRRVQARLHARGLSLILWDCYRPLSVQRRLWARVPDERYVADPAKGSRHNRGAAVDVGLLDASGHPLDLGTAFDDFTPRAHRDAALPAPIRANRALLDEAMATEGFTGLPTEWWHYDAPDWPRYPLSDAPL